MSDPAFPAARAEDRARAEDVIRPSVGVACHTSRIALVTLVGEQDLSTRAYLRDALAYASEQPCVVVDLSRCTFVDSSVIGALVALACTGVSSVRLVVPETQLVVRRTFELVGMGDFFPLHDSLEEGLIAAGDDVPVQEPAREVTS
jgi:anti-anti-sigma factor